MYAKESAKQYPLIVILSSNNWWAVDHVEHTNYLAIACLSTRLHFCSCLLNTDISEGEEEQTTLKLNTMNFNNFKIIFATRKYVRHWTTIPWSTLASYMFCKLRRKSANTAIRAVWSCYKTKEVEKTWNAWSVRSAQILRIHYGMSFLPFPLSLFA
jgi:hypothetical protein